MDMKIKLGENGPTRATTTIKTTDSTPKSTPKGEVRPGFRRLLERKTSNTSTTNALDTDDELLHLAAIEGVEYESQQGDDSSDNSHASPKDEKTPSRAKAATSTFAQNQAGGRASASSAHPATPSSDAPYSSRAAATDKNAKKPVQEGFVTAKPPSTASHTGATAINRTQSATTQITLDTPAGQDFNQFYEVAPFQSPSSPSSDRIQVQVESYQEDSQEPPRAPQLGLGRLVRAQEHLPATTSSINTSLAYSTTSSESIPHLIEPSSALAHSDTPQHPRDSRRAASSPFKLSSHLAHNSAVGEAIEDAPERIESSITSQSAASQSAASQSVASQSVASQSVASQSVASQSVASQSAASQSVASQSVASQSVASQSVASQSVASQSVASTGQQPRDFSRPASSPFALSSHLDHNSAVAQAVETESEPIAPSVASRSDTSRSTASTAQRLVPVQKSASIQVSSTLKSSEGNSVSARAAQAALGDGFVRLDKLQAPTKNAQLDNRSLTASERPAAQKIATASTATQTAMPTHKLVVTSRDQVRSEVPVVVSAHYEQLSAANSSPAPVQTHVRTAQVSSAQPRATSLLVEQTPLASTAGSSSVAATSTSQVSTAQIAVVQPRAIQTNVAPQVEVRPIPSTAKTLPVTNAQAPTAQASVSSSVAKATPPQLSTLSSRNAAESSRSSQPASANSWTSEAETRATTASSQTSQLDAVSLREEIPQIETPEVEIARVSFEADQDPAATEGSHTLRLDDKRAHEGLPQATNALQVLTPAAPYAAVLDFQEGRVQAVEAQDDPDGVLFDDLEFDLESSSQTSASPFNRRLLQQAERMAVAPSTQGIPLQQTAAVMSASAPLQTQDSVAIVESISVQIAQAHLMDRADTTLVLQNPPLFAGAEIVIQQHKSAPGELSVSFHNLNAQAAGLISTPANQALLRENLVRKGFIIHVLQVAQTPSPQTRFTSEGQRVTFKTNDRESSENESQDTHGREGSKERKRQ